MNYILVTRNGKSFPYIKYDQEDHELLNQYKWHYTPGGYLATQIRGADGKPQNISMHRLLMSAKKGDIIDHKDGEQDNNRKLNLRFVTHQQNMVNRKVSKNNKCGYRGIYWGSDRKKWRIKIELNTKVVLRKSYNTLEEAVVAYNAAALKYYGEYARLNPLP